MSSPIDSIEATLVMSEVQGQNPLLIIGGILLVAIVVNIGIDVIRKQLAKKRKRAEASKTAVEPIPENEWGMEAN